MKKSTVILNALSLGVVLTTTSVYAADGTIHFFGSITDDACTIVNDTTNPLTVTLGTVSSNAFTGVGSTAAPTKFTIDLTDCPATVTTASIKFDGQSYNDNDPTALSLTNPAASGSAKNVGIQLAEINGATIDLYTSSLDFNLVEGDNNVPFVARYVAMGATVGAGTANGTSDFTIIYN